MQKIALTALVRTQLEDARRSASGRSSHTVFGGHDTVLRQTLICILGGQRLDEHESPAEATLYVVQGRVRLETEEASWDGITGDYLVIPDQRHGMTALVDSAVMLTVATRR